jgi:hypothetical protein
LLGFSSLAQETFTKKNTISIGINFPASGVSYDRILAQKSAWKFSGQLHIAPAHFGLGKGFGGGLGFNAFRGRENHHLQLGLNYTYLHKAANLEKNFTELNLNLVTPTIGYRYQKPNGGLFFTANVGPMFGFENRTFFIPIPGGNVGIGFSF